MCFRSFEKSTSNSARYNSPPPFVVNALAINQQTARFNVKSYVYKVGNSKFYLRRDLMLVENRRWCLQVRSYRVLASSSATLYQIINKEVYAIISQIKMIEIINVAHSKKAVQS